MTSEVRSGLGLIVLALVAAGSIWIFMHPTALRDDSQCSPKPYSYARVQLWWWTNVILFAWLVIWTRKGEFWQFNETCLALLGISAATTAAARVVDGRDNANPSVVRHQNMEASKSWFEDILSDGKGVSIHRFQSLIFNVAYAFAFLLTSLGPNQTAFHSFDGSTLLLLGVSTATYVAVKGSENGAQSPEVNGLKGSNLRSDEVLDPGGYDDMPDERGVVRS